MGLELLIAFCHVSENTDIIFREIHVVLCSILSWGKKVCCVHVQFVDVGQHGLSHVLFFIYFSCGI